MSEQQVLEATDNATNDGATANGAAAPRARFVITPQDVERLLGPVKFQAEMGNRAAQIGVSTGLAWTPVGGEVLFIETARIPGRGGGLTLTGQLGDVMKESAQIALDFLRSHPGVAGIPTDGPRDFDIHLHVPAGAIPKDGPSAGIAITTALASLLSNRPARHDIAMTGEVTLTGRVLPIGGVKEKVLAARQAGITTVILPERNRPDVRDVPEEAQRDLEFIFADDVRNVLDVVLLPPVDDIDAVEAAPDVATPLEQDTTRAEVTPS